MTYFAKAASLFAGCDVVFFDPDNGLEIASRPRERRNSCKHLYWEEVSTTYQSGASVLVYQHFVREKRDSYTARIADQLKASTGAAAVFAFSTPHVLFILAAQQRHLAAFRTSLPVIGSRWNGQIAVSEFCTQTRPLTPVTIQSCTGIFVRVTIVEYPSGLNGRFARLSSNLLNAGPSSGDAGRLHQ